MYPTDIKIPEENVEWRGRDSDGWRFGHFLTDAGSTTSTRPKIFKANQIAWFHYTKFQHHDQDQNQHHDWNLLNKFGYW